LIDVEILLYIEVCHHSLIKGGFTHAERLGSLSPLRDRLGGIIESMTNDIGWASSAVPTTWTTLTARWHVTRRVAFIIWMKVMKRQT